MDGTQEWGRRLREKDQLKESMGEGNDPHHLYTRCKEAMGTRKEKLSLMETTAKNVCYLDAIFLLACPRNEPPSWLSSAEWSAQKSYNHIHINKKRAQQLFMYFHRNIHTYMYICNNDNNLRKRRCQLERGHGTCWKKDTWEGLERGKEEMMELYFNLKYILKK